VITNNKQPLVSVLTPTWNRAEYLEKVWRGLVAQEYRNFEWVVGNDGSNDNTVEVLRALAKKSDFPIKLIDSNIRAGKPRMDNLLMSNSSGELLIQNDSDDVLLPEALKLMVEEWESIPEDNRSNYLGIRALSISTDDKIQSKGFENQLVKLDTTFEELESKMRDDSTHLIPAKSVTNRRFLEVDFIIPESSLWSLVFKNKRVIYLPVVVKVMDRKAPGSVSFGKKLEYTRGMAYSISIAEDELSFVRRNFLMKCNLIVRYWRYCFHGEIEVKKAKKMWCVTRNNSWTMLFWPISFLYVIKDLVQRKVVKTHRDFEKAKASAKIKVVILN